MGSTQRLQRLVPLADAAQRRLVAPLGEGAADPDVVAVDEEVAHHHRVEGDEVGGGAQDALVLAGRAVARERGRVRHPAHVLAPRGEAGRVGGRRRRELRVEAVAPHVVPTPREVDGGGRRGRVDADAAHARVPAGRTGEDRLVRAGVEVEAVEGVRVQRGHELGALEGAAQVEVVALGVVGDGLEGAAGADRAVGLHATERAPSVGAGLVRVVDGERVDVVVPVAARVVDLGELAHHHQATVGQPGEIVDHAVRTGAAVGRVEVGDHLVAVVRGPGPQVPLLVGLALGQVRGVDAGLPDAGEPKLALVPLQPPHGGLPDPVAHAGPGRHLGRARGLRELTRPMLVALGRPGAAEQDPDRDHHQHPRRTPVFGHRTCSSRCHPSTSSVHGGVAAAAAGGDVGSFASLTRPI